MGACTELQWRDRGVCEFCIARRVSICIYRGEMLCHRQARALLFSSLRALRIFFFFSSLLTRCFQTLFRIFNTYNPVLLCMCVYGHARLSLSLSRPLSVKFLRFPSPSLSLPLSLHIRAMRCVVSFRYPGLG